MHAFLYNTLYRRSVRVTDRMTLDEKLTCGEIGHFYFFFHKHEYIPSQYDKVADFRSVFRTINASIEKPIFYVKFVSFREGHWCSTQVPGECNS